MSFACRLLVLLLFVLTGTGCSIFQEYDETAGWDASQLYTAGKEALDEGDYQKAIQLYTKLEARFPYGRYTQQAQLETAYVHYKDGEPQAAIAAADRFIKLHPRHPNVDYAYYMRGLASFDPGRSFLDRFFPQDSAQRDPTTARESFRYFSELVQRFPTSRYSQDAIQRMTYLRNNLARHEIQVADYYLRRGAPLAAANRGKYVLEHYQRTPSVPDALEIMVRAYREMGMDDLAADALKVLAQNHPERAAQLVP
ncbi:outer membrane protein assembly factor BamD [Sulfurivermis fontis]|uniref:outer membrane protein assembly factor BamD n=1 Tax=Sulfurivermis fontis TaxID=1972068 RepID=UPI000FD79CD9|nr:outer membrane protein assembly factor BamD [Sulfurivermis fontis]